MEIKEGVKEKYGQAALRVHTGVSSCCGAGPALPDGCCDPITSGLYDAAQTAVLPEEAVLASPGCGNPTALAQLNAGETVLDPGSGGGIDVLRIYDINDVRAFLKGQGVDADAIAPQVDSKFIGAFIRAVKPAVMPAPCCAPGCCT